MDARWACVHNEECLLTRMCTLWRCKSTPTRKAKLLWMTSRCGPTVIRSDTEIGNGKGIIRGFGDSPKICRLAGGHYTPLTHGPKSPTLCQFVMRFVDVLQSSYCLVCIVGQQSEWPPISGTVRVVFFVFLFFFLHLVLFLYSVKVGIVVLNVFSVLVLFVRMEIIIIIIIIIGFDCLEYYRFAKFQVIAIRGFVLTRL